MAKEKNTRKKLIIIISVMMGIVLLLIICLIGTLFSRVETGVTGEATSSTDTAEPIADYEYVMENEEMFLKYGNFKNYETALNVIEASIGSTNKEAVQNEVFNYWFTLIRYGDYTDAYTFIATEKIMAYGIDYSYEDFVVDCEDMCVKGGIDDDLWLNAEIVEGSTPSELGYGNLHMAIITSNAAADEGVALFMPYYMTNDYMIIPFDISQQSAMDRYNPAQSDISIATTEHIEEPASSETSVEVSEDVLTEEHNTSEPVSTEALQ